MPETLTFVDFAGRRSDGTLVKGVIPQFDGSRFGSGNCAAVAEAVRDRVEAAARAVSGQPWPPTGATIRAGTGDTEGGLNAYQTAAVSRREYRIGSDIRIVPWSVVIDKLRAGYVVTLLVKYGPIADAGESGSPGFRSNHSISLLGIRGSGPGIEIYYTEGLRDGRRPGIPKGPTWIRLSVLKRAANQLMIDADDGRTLSDIYGAGRAYVSFGITAYEGPPEGEKPVAKAKKLRRPRRVKVLYDRSNLRSRPRKRAANVVRLVDKGWRFDAFWFVENADGRWLGNKTKTRWLYRPGVAFVKYLGG